MEKYTVYSKYNVVYAIKDNRTDHFLSLGEIQDVVHLVRVHDEQTLARSQVKL